MDFAGGFVDLDSNDFPFNPAFDSHKLPPSSNTRPSSTYDSDPDTRHQPAVHKDLPDDSGVQLYDPDYPPSYAEREESPGYGNFLDKPHLFTVDPYAKSPAPYSGGYAPAPYSSPPAYHAPPPAASYEPAYQPPAYEPHQPAYPPHHEEPKYAVHDPYQSVHHDPYAPHKPVHHAPEPYKPHYEAPYKPVGPVLLEKRPHEVKEILPLPVPLHDTPYKDTNFDCKKVPYADKHYADVESGCHVSVP